MRRGRRPDRPWTGDPGFRAGRPGSPDCVTTPHGKDDAELDGEVGPLGSAVAPPDDPASSGGDPERPGDEAGPSYPPAGTEPDAHR